MIEIQAELRAEGDDCPLKYWCQDETRLGLQTLLGKRITLPGVKPIQAVGWEKSSVAPLEGLVF